ncbi:hypothetical protein [Marinomonas sp. 2405UD68-3]|uniref:hypothetical protein n=1 Tax=Marinomonas sp. 2405UD68-3 TaxID=3391835 RepID=UPI0039C99721
MGSKNKQSYFDIIAVEALEHGLMRGMVDTNEVVNWVREISTSVMPYSSELNSNEDHELSERSEYAYANLHDSLTKANPLLISYLIKSAEPNILKYTLENAKLWLNIDASLSEYIDVFSIMYGGEDICDAETIIQIKDFFENCSFKISPLLFILNNPTGGLDIVLPIFKGFPDEVVLWQEMSVRIASTYESQLKQIKNCSYQFKTQTFDVPALYSITQSILTSNKGVASHTLAKLIKVIHLEYDMDFVNTSSCGTSFTTSELSSIESGLKNEPRSNLGLMTTEIHNDYSQLSESLNVFLLETESQLTKLLKKIKRKAPATIDELKIFAEHFSSSEVFDSIYDRRLILGSCVTNFEADLTEMSKLSTKDLLLLLTDVTQKKGMAFSPAIFELSTDFRALGVH